MKLINLKVRNFIRLENLEINFGQSAGHFISGLNEQGKSSLVDAIVFGLTGEPVRVEQKKHLPYLISWGTNAGSVEVQVLMNVEDQFTTTWTRDIETGKGTDPIENPYIPYILHPQKWSHQKPSERKGMMHHLLGLSMTPGEWRKELEAHDVPEDMIARILPHTLAGFEAAHTRAKQTLTQLRGQWKGITGEVYGTTKAATWKADEAESLIGGNSDALEAEIIENAKRVQLLSDKINIARDEIRQIERLGDTHPCPKCKAELRFEKGELVAAGKRRDRKLKEKAGLEANIKEDTGELNALRDATQDLKSNLKELQREDTRTDDAFKVHEDILQWIRAEELLGPNGIPGKQAAKSLDRFNKRLRTTADITGRKLVSVTPEFDLLVEGKPFALQSVSSQWWTDAAIADCIAHISELKVLVLDGFDVVAPISRGGLMYWTHSLIENGDYDTVLVVGTLDSIPKPEEVPPTFVHHRLENGAFVD